MKTHFERKEPCRPLLGSIGSEPFTRASPRAIILATPYLGLGQRRHSDTKYVASKWVAAIPVAPRTEEFAGSVVDSLLQVAANPQLRPSIPADFWLWLNERPPLPPICEGRWLGGGRDVVRTVRVLKDINILTSYLIAVWSEWEQFYPDGFSEMQVSIREDFNGIGMGCHRAELIQRLDCVLGELDRRAGRFYSDLEDDRLWRHRVGDDLLNMKDQYGQLKRMLQEAEERTPHSFIFPSLLTLIDPHRIPLHLRVCLASPVSITSHLERSALRAANRFVYSNSTSSLFPCAFPADLNST
jgi:hypothetical protein